MENTIKIERLNAAAIKAEKTINRAQNWEANRNNAAARLFAINAAAAIIDAATPVVLAAAVNSRGFQFDAAIRGCYQAIKAAATLERRQNWAKVTAERAERAENKGKNARKRAERAAAKAAQ